MKQRSKRYNQSLEKLKTAEEKIQKIEQALDLLLGLDKEEKVKFKESVEVHIKLGIDPSKSEQHVRSSLELPHGSGKSPKVAVFAKGEKAKEAKEAKADHVFSEKDIEKFQQGKEKIDFDVVIATPDMMPQLAKIAKILGPKGLMPSPKNQTVTTDVKKMIESVKKGLANVKSDRGGSIHQIIGKIDFDKKKLLENYQALISEIEKNKPAKMKGKFLKAVYVSTTMSPSIKVR
jgi:large subunit ribosomal protein L1